MKKKLFIVAIIIVLIITIYLHPYKIKQEVYVCSLDGDIKKISLNLVKQNALLSPARLLGSISFNQELYTSIYELPYYSKSNFLRNLRDKINIGTRIGYFVKLNESNFFHDYIIIYFKDKEHDTIEITVFQNNREGISYFGPAQSIEEVNQILN